LRIVVENYDETYPKSVLHVSLGGRTGAESLTAAHAQLLVSDAFGRVLGHIQRRAKSRSPLADRAEHGPDPAGRQS
jgi:hypothetical protein